MKDQTEEIVEEVTKKISWNWNYTLVLLLNISYVILFYYLMNAYQL